MFRMKEKTSISKRRLTFLRGCAFVALAACAIAACSAPTGVQNDAARVATLQEPDTKGAPTSVRLVTGAQLLNTVAYLFGPDVKTITRFPPMERVEGLLQIGAGRAGINDNYLEIYRKASTDVAALVMDVRRRNFLIGCTPANPNAADNACATQFLSRVGRILFRQPLDKARTDEVVGIANTAADTLGDFYSGLGIALETLLVSPKTLFVVDRAEPDPARPGEQRLDAYSLASRLSFFLWNAAPDDTVLKAAESGEILTPKGRAKIVDMMLASPRLEKGVRAFFDDMLAFDDLEVLAKDPQIYPVFTGNAVGDAREQALRTITELLVTERSDYRDLFTTRKTFVSPALAAVYQMPTNSSWMAYEFPKDSPRIGILTQAAFLAGHSHPGRSSPTLRGKALRELLFCQKVPPPPPNVDFSAVENPDPNIKTARDRLDVHHKNPVCAGCHKITDPLGLALENFDGAGQYRENEKGAPIDATGALDGVPFNDPATLGKVLHDSPALTSCLTRRVLSYATSNANADAEVLKYFNAQFGMHGYRIPDLLRVIALSESFSRVRAPESTTKTADAGALTNAAAK